MSEILTAYGIPCPVCWNEIERNCATLEVLKDWNGVKYIFRFGKWFCTHCDGTGDLTLEAISKFIGSQIDIGE